MAGKGIQFTDELRDYLVAHSSPDRAAVHNRLVEHTKQVIGDLAIMQVSEEQGPWLSFMVGALGVKVAAEVGTFTGYSALCIAEALPEGGMLHCFDSSSEYTDVAKPFWEEAGVSDRINLVIGDAVDTLSQLQGPIDFAFIDADKENYLRYYEMLLGLMDAGGVIVADNALWSGAVLDPTITDSSTVAIREFNDVVAADPRVDSLLVNVGDGLMLARKL